MFFPLRLPFEHMHRFDISILERQAAEAEAYALGARRGQFQRIQHQAADMLLVPPAEPKAHLFIEHNPELFFQPPVGGFSLGMKLKPALFTEIARKFEQIVGGKVKIKLVMRVLFHKRAKIAESSLFENRLSFFSAVWKNNRLMQKGLA